MATCEYHPETGLDASGRCPRCEIRPTSGDWVTRYLAELDAAKRERRNARRRNRKV